MKAVYITKYGGNDQLVYGSLQRPEPKSGQVLVRVRAAAVNPRDWIVRDGHYVFKFALPRFPIILGSDFSGEVVKRGPNASQFRIGDEVFGMQPLWGAMGAYAEYVAIAETALTRKPSSISHVDAAAVPCAGLTAWQALVNIGGVGQGTRVTVCGASGGVGSYAVQFAVSAGVILTHVVGVKMTHLGEDGGFMAADDADPGAGSGDQGTRASWRGNSGDRKAAWLFAEYGEAVLERHPRRALRAAATAADQA